MHGGNSSNQNKTKAVVIKVIQFSARTLDGSGTDKQPCELLPVLFLVHVSALLAHKQKRFSLKVIPKHERLGAAMNATALGEVRDTRHDWIQVFNIITRVQSYI